MCSILFPSDKLVYMMVDLGNNRYITEVKLKDVPLLERIKNVFGFGAMNLGKIVDYCLATDKILNNFKCFQDAEKFLLRLRNDYRMKNPDGEKHCELLEKIDRSHLPLQELRQKLIQTIEEKISQNEEEGRDVSSLNKQKEILLSPFPWIINNKPKIEIYHEAVNPKNKIRDGLVTRLDKLVSEVDPEFRFQMAVILLSKNPLSADELDSFLIRLKMSQNSDIWLVKDGKLPPFELVNYHQLKELKIPLFEDLPKDLQKRSEDFLKARARETGARQEAEFAALGKPSQKELEKLCK